MIHQTMSVANGDGILVHQASSDSIFSSLSSVLEDSLTMLDSGLSSPSASAAVLGGRETVVFSSDSTLPSLGSFDSSSLDAEEKGPRLETEAVNGPEEEEPSVSVGGTDSGGVTHVKGNGHASSGEGGIQERKSHASSGKGEVQERLRSVTFGNHSPIDKPRSKELNVKRLSLGHTSDHGDLCPLYEDSVDGSSRYGDYDATEWNGGICTPTGYRVSVYSLQSAFTYLDEQGIMVGAPLTTG